MIEYEGAPNVTDEVIRRNFQEGMALFKNSTVIKDIAYLKVIIQ